MCLLHFGAPSFLLGAHWALLGSPFRHVGGLRVKNHRVFDVFAKYFLGGAQRAPKIDFGRVWESFEGFLRSLFGHVGGAVELLGHRLGPKWRQKQQDEGLKSDLGSSRGGQGVSEALNGSILGRRSSLVVCYLVFWYVFSKQGFVHRVCRVA